MEGIIGGTTQILGELDLPDYKEKFLEVCEERAALEKELIQWRQHYHNKSEEVREIEKHYQERMQAMAQALNEAQKPTALQRLGNRIKSVYTWTFQK